MKFCMYVVDHVIFEGCLNYSFDWQDLDTLTQNAIPRGIALGRDLNLTEPLGMFILNSHEKIYL